MSCDLCKKGPATAGLLCESCSDAIERLVKISTGIFGKEEPMASAKSANRTANVGISRVSTIS